MSQIALPTSLVTTAWSGSYTDLTDASDATYIESPLSPEASETFVCALGAVSDPAVDTGHQIVVRAAISPVDGDPQDLVLVLENTDDDSVVATCTYTDIPDALVDRIFALTEEEAALIHSYAGLRIRGYAAASTSTVMPFFWESVPGATSYVLHVGTGVGLSDRYNANVGYVLTHELKLTAGTYYSRVVPYQDGTPLTPTDEQMVVVA